MHRATIITDLTFGDAGKGTITDALVRRGAGLVVRYNGGAQAAHTVVDAAAGRQHSFHQFGSGTFVDGVETLLSRFVLVNPVALYFESLELEELGVGNALQRMRVDARALVTTPYHVALNRLREMARGDARHGSCGLGIGETTADALASTDPALPLCFGDLADAALLRRKLRDHRELKQRHADCLASQLDILPVAESRQVYELLNQLHSNDEFEAACEVFETIAASVHLAGPNFLPERMSRPGATIFEGAQGVLLDEEWGFHPHTTWSNTTSANALRLVEECGASVSTTVLGLTRAYQTRHGAGPFPTEDASLTRVLAEPDNPANPWQGAFRAGWLDLSLLAYAIRVDERIDGLVMTCLDRLEAVPDRTAAVSYEIDGKPWPLLPAGIGRLDESEHSGNQLGRAVPVYASAPRDSQEFAGWTAGRLGLPLLGVSFGRTAAEKCFYDVLPASSNNPCAGT